MNTDATAHFTAGTTPSAHIMSSLIEYNPFQAFLGSKQVQSRSPWPLHSADESLTSPWQQPLQHPVFDDISTVGGKTSAAMASFQPWRWYAAGTGLSLPSPSVTGVTDANNLSPGRTKRSTPCSPSRTGVQTRTGSDLCVSGWHAGSNASRFSWSTPGGDYDSYYPQQQQQQQQQLLQHSNYNATYLGTSPTSGSNQFRGAGDTSSRLFETAVNVGDNSGVITSQGQSSAGSSSVDAMTAAVARYINDRWYSAAAGYGSTLGAGSTAGDGNDDGRFRPHQVGVSPHRNAAVDNRSDIYSAAVSGNIDLHLQSTGSSIRPGSLFVPPSNGSASFPGGPWTWEASMAGGNSSCLLPSCGRSVTSETGENHGKQMTKSSSVMSEYENMTSSRPVNFRFPGFSSNNPAVSSNSSPRIPDVGGVNAANSENGTGKPSSEQKKSRNVDLNVGNSRPPTQRTGRQHPANSNSGGTANSVGVRSTATACECPNCREADRIGGVAGDHIRRLGQHSCHVPGCGKVYTKTSHLKAHLHWHNAGSVITSTSIASGSSVTSGGSSATVRTTEPLTCIRPACRQRFSRLEDLQRHMKEHAADAATGPSSSSKKHASAKSKKQTSDDSASELYPRRSPTSNGMLNNEGTDSCVEKMARQAVAAGSSPAGKTSLKRSPLSTGSSSGDVLNDVIVKRKRSAETPVGGDTADAASGDILSVQSSA